LTEHTKDIKKILKNIIGFSLGGILTKAVGFFLIPIYTRFLTPADYGILEIAHVIIAILSILFVAGQIGSLQRFFFDYNKDEKKLREYIGTIVLFVLIISSCLTVMLLLFGKPLFSLIEGMPFNPYIPIVLFISFFSVLLAFPQRLLQVRQKAYHYSLLDLARFLVTVAGIVFFVVIRKQGALGSLKGQLAASVLSFAVAVFLLKGDVVFKFDTAKLRESLSFGLPLVPHALAGWILTFADRAMINHYIDLTQVGIYSLGYKFGMVMSLLVTSANLAWAPFFMNTMNERGEEGPRAISRLATLYIAAMLFIAMAISFFAKEIIQVMATKEFLESYKVIPIIVASYVFQGLYFIVVNQVFYIKKTKVLPFITFGAAIVNIFLNIWWITSYGIYGAAWATMASFAVIFVFTWVLARKVFPIRYEYSRIALVFIVAFACSALSMFLKQDRMLLSIMIKAVCLGIFPLVLYLTGFFKASGLSSLLELFNKGMNR